LDAAEEIRLLRGALVNVAASLTDVRAALIAVMDKGNLPEQTREVAWAELVKSSEHFGNYLALMKQLSESPDDK